MIRTNAPSEVVDRAQRTHAADVLCVSAYDGAGCPATGAALIAVGGYGRRELAPFSDLDVLLVHDDQVAPGEWAARVWYPLWDSGQAVDHAVRTLSEVLDLAARDLKVALGLLDARHLAGDGSLTLRLRNDLLAAWRRDARNRLPELAGLVQVRGRRVGELADAAVPDLKASAGGLRDAGVLKALVATWLVDVPHGDLERARVGLLDVRDALHTVAGRPGDRVPPELWPDLAAVLGLADGLAAQRHTRALGRRITHLSRLTWRRVGALLRAPRPTRDGRRPRLELIGGGLAVAHEEVVLAGGVPPEQDLLVLLRAAAEAATRDLVLAPSTAARLVRDAPDLPDPWPAPARGLLVRLLAAGRGLLGVWETLEETGGITRLFPEWDLVRLLPHASTVHRFTVDRHLVETCIEASVLIRDVSRPDVLMVAALLHDIGKGRPGDHSVAGEPIARAAAARIGFDTHEADLVAGLVRWHLLLSGTATTRDLDDPLTLADVAARVGGREQLDLLGALTEADARATSGKAWTSWRADLVTDLVRRTAATMGDAPVAVPAHPMILVPERLRTDPDEIAVLVDPGRDGSLVTVICRDRLGLLADASAMLALGRLSVREARAWTDGELGISQWQVAEEDLDPSMLRERLVAIGSGRLDAARRLAGPSPDRLAPVVVVRPGAWAQATVLEVRTADHRGVVHRVCRALTGLGLTIRSAHVETLGPQAVDVFYVQEAGTALAQARAADAARAVHAAL